MTWIISFVLITIIFCGCTLRLKNKSLQLEELFYQKTHKPQEKLPIPPPPRYHPPTEKTPECPIVIREEEETEEIDMNIGPGPQDEMNVEPEHEEEKKEEEFLPTPWWNIWD